MQSVDEGRCTGLIATKRLLLAAKALAQVRKLMGVNLQINVAEQQLNVAG
jgi:hypothetical protein